MTEPASSVAVCAVAQAGKRGSETLMASRPERRRRPARAGRILPVAGPTIWNRSIGDTVLVLVAALRRTIPLQRPGVLVGVELEQIGADRTIECRVVDLQGEVVSGLLAGAFPGCSDFRADLGA